MPHLPPPFLLHTRRAPAHLLRVTLLGDIAWWCRALWATLPWYINLQLLSLAAFPLVFGVCSRLRDRGYAAAKALGLVLACYAAWVLAHLGGDTPAGWHPRLAALFDMLRDRGVIVFGYNAVAVGASLLAVASALAAMLSWREISDFVRRNVRVIVVTECVFLAAFLLAIASAAEPDPAIESVQ